MIKENWKVIPDFPGYEVSDCGRVRSYWSRGRPGLMVLPTIKKQYFRNKYLFVPLQQNKIQRTCDVHRLVLLTFIGPCPIGMEACHNDGNQTHNHLTNLRWDTPLNNSEDKRKHGTMNYGERNGESKLTNDSVIEIRHLSSLGYKGCSTSVYV